MPRPRIPKHIKIGPHLYRVQLVAAKAIPGLNGDTSPDELLIRIHKRIPVSLKRVVLLHEICHAIHWLVYGPLAADDPHTDEQWIEATAGHLVQVLRDNPRLDDYLLAKEPLAE